MPNAKPLTVTENQSLDEPEGKFVDAALDGMTTPAKQLQVLLPVLLSVERPAAFRPQTVMLMPLRDNAIKSKAIVGRTTLTGVSIQFSKLVDVHGVSN